MGRWYDRTKEFAARVRRERFHPQQFSEVEEVVLSPLPCWMDLSDEQKCRAVEALIDSILEEIPKDEAIRPIRDRLHHQVATHRPAWVKRSPMPWFHCASRSVREELREAYGLFLISYREASEHWKRGQLTAPFPDGCFLPPGPFLAAS
jgi:hypothetical protein